MAADENTPLLPGRESTNGEPKSFAARLFGVQNRILFAGFLITLSFSFTQVPLFYLFHLMQCDVFYSDHPPYEGTGDRCSRNEIAAGTALQYSILGASTTVCGVLNLFVTGWTIKRFGPRFALYIQTLVPAIRVAAQIIGVLAGGRNGIIIIQCTQLVTIIGGPAGYILVVNTIVGEVVEPLKRTAVFGQLQGCLMIGQTVGYMTGSLIGDKFGVRRPFDVAFCFFLLSTVYARIALPYISAESMNDGGKAKAKGLAGFFEPLKVLAPQKIRLESGVIKKHYGVMFLCLGVFIGVVATGYAPLLIQMFATAIYDFDQSANGWLMSGYAMFRGLFLIFVFPRIISLGRRWFRWRAKRTLPDKVEEPRETPSEIPEQPGEIEAPTATERQEEPVKIDPAEEKESCAFDLFFLRWSLLLDGFLTIGPALATKSWNIYLAAFLLPLGSGTAPAAKGVITEMCPPSQRGDALNAITLVENLARLVTQGLFGLIFAALAEVGQVHLTFYCNAAIAVIGMLVLLLSHFPPPGSKLVEDDEVEVEGSD